MASNHVQLTLAGVHLTVVAADYSIVCIILAGLDAICNMMLLLSVFVKLAPIVTKRHLSPKLARQLVS